MVFPKKKKYKLRCEWASCDKCHEDMDEFYRHLDDHFCRDVVGVPMEPGCTLVCQWQECNFATTNDHELIRHLYFHGFHTKLKWLGLLRHQAAKSNECQIHHNRNIIPELPDGFKCCWQDCYVIVDIPDKFYEHVREHALISDPEKTSDGKEVFKCLWEGCTYTYTAGDKAQSMGRYKLKGHMSTHTQERCFACPWCGNLYVNTTKLIDHFTRQINAENHSFQCTHCSRTFASERILKDHMRHHVNHYKCPKCAMTCPNPSALKHHIRYKHSTERPYACEFCEYRSKEPHDLQTHMQFHQSDLAYHCQVEGCDYVVRSIQNLRYHYRVKHGSDDGKYYACHMCDKKYGTGYQLTHHLRKAHNFQWPPGHCRFRYKESDDGMFRLQTFRYESTLIKQISLTDPQEHQTVDRDSSSGAGISTLTQAKTRASTTKSIKITRKKAGAANKRVGPVSPSHTVISGTNLRQIPKRKANVKRTFSKKVADKSNSKKRKSKSSPRKITKRNLTPSKTYKKEILKKNPEHLPDLFINSECLEAADTLCNMKSNSAKKKQVESLKDERDVHIVKAVDSSDNILDKILQSTTNLDDQMQESPDTNMRQRAPGVTTRSSSGKKSTSRLKLKLVKAKKRLRLSDEQNVSSGNDLNASVKQNTARDAHSEMLMECSVNLVPVDEPVFPNHHKLYCLPASAPQNPSVSEPLLTTLTTVQTCTEEELEHVGSSGILLNQLAENLTTSTGDTGCRVVTDVTDLGRVQPSKLATLPSSEISEIPENISAYDSSTGVKDNQPVSNLLLPTVMSQRADNIPEKMEAEGINNQNKEEDGKMVEVNSSEIVTDEEGNKTVVNVGGEEFYLVSGTDTKSGGTVYCLVKASEFADNDEKQINGI